MLKILGSFFILGLSFGFGPCISSCGPLLIAYSAGTNKDIKKSILTYLLFSLGRILVYLALGALIFLFGQLVAKFIFQRYILITGGVIIVLVGALIAIGRSFDHKLCLSLGDFFIKKDAKTVFLFGLLIGLLPCAPFLSVLSYVGFLSRSLADSFFYSLAFGLGTLISPLFILAALAGLIPKALASRGKFQRVFNLICGLVIIFLGVQLILRGF